MDIISFLLLFGEKYHTQARVVLLWKSGLQSFSENQGEVLKHRRTKLSVVFLSFFLKGGGKSVSISVYT